MILQQLLRDMRRTDVKIDVLNVDSMKYLVQIHDHPTQLSVLEVFFSDQNLTGYQTNQTVVCPNTLALSSGTRMLDVYVRADMARTFVFFSFVGDMRTVSRQVCVVCKRER